MSTPTHAESVQRSRATAQRRSSGGPDAVALLKADHREVESLFQQFGKARSVGRRSDLALRICRALQVHTTIEEEIFYPAFLEATGDKDIHHEAEVEHAGAKILIQQISASVPDDEYFVARVKVLSEAIKHHVKEEEQRGGMFAKAKGAGLDLEALGAQMKARKAELEKSMK